MSLLDVRQQSAADFQTLRCSALPTAWPHNPWMTLECATIGPWHRCGAPGCPRPWFRHREAPRISVCLRYSSPSPGETYEMCSACARSTIYGDLWGAC
ncbi:hypothetical protein DUNSADRAFT_16950 [Dunaliella salina]|uniref:Encoded protein n=1 Tax=Dunaliella salina TaxID=3046 RepID=A0ABQ7H0M4_DUNSA|nr:hypothetical protein DUNSADRAFT_16950 [Dunaliella salina]|eukprot:KAF5840402.1 hypothetical protein DUNSADRAFT_16950 [Dunaliella salina]